MRRARQSDRNGAPNEAVIQAGRFEVYVPVLTLDSPVRFIQQGLDVTCSNSLPRGNPCKNKKVYVLHITSAHLCGDSLYR